MSSSITTAGPTSGCSRLREGDRIAALTVWGADAERVWVPEANAVEVPEDLDPAEVASLVLTYMTAIQLLHRTAPEARDGREIAIWYSLYVRMAQRKPRCDVDVSTACAMRAAGR